MTGCLLYTEGQGTTSHWGKMVVKLRAELQEGANFPAKLREEHIRPRARLMQSPVRASFVGLRSWEKATLSALSEGEKNFPDEVTPGHTEPGSRVWAFFSKFYSSQ